MLLFIMAVNPSSSQKAASLRILMCRNCLTIGTALSSVTILLRITSISKRVRLSPLSIYGEDYHIHEESCFIDLARSHAFMLVIFALRTSYLVILYSNDIALVRHLASHIPPMATCHRKQIEQHPPVIPKSNGTSSSDLQP